MIKTYKQRIGLTASEDDFINLKGKTYYDFIREDCGSKIWRLFFIKDVKSVRGSIVIDYELFEEKIKDGEYAEVLESKKIKEGSIKISKKSINLDKFPKHNLLKHVYSLISCDNN